MAKSTRSPTECTRLFLRAAEHRLAEAHWILANSGYTTAAVYLAGYSVECALKAVLLAHLPKLRHKETKQSFRSKAGHDYDWLSRRLHAQSVIVPKPVARHIADVIWWNTFLRYQSAEIGRFDADLFLVSTEHIFKWAERTT